MICSAEDDEGYTLLEMMLVITLFAVFSAMVIPVTRAFQLNKMPEHELLRQWLAHQKLNAVLSSVPERICIGRYSVTAEFWQDKQWKTSGQKFIPEPGSHLSYRDEDISDENEHCYHVSATQFHPAGGFLLVQGKKQYRYVWGENGEFVP